MDAALRFLLDENMRGILLTAIHRHNRTFAHQAIDVVQVGDIPDLPRGTPDPDVLIWAEQENRLLLSWDKRSLPRHLAEHLAAGRHCPGILIPSQHVAIKPLISQLVLIAYASLPGEYSDQITNFRLD